MKLKIAWPAIPLARGNQSWDEAGIVNENKDRDERNWFPDGKNWATRLSKPEARLHPQQSSNKS